MIRDDLRDVDDWEWEGTADEAARLLVCNRMKHWPCPSGSNCGWCNEAVMDWRPVVAEAREYGDREEWLEKALIEHWYEVGAAAAGYVEDAALPVFDPASVTYGYRDPKILSTAYAYVATADHCPCKPGSDCNDCRATRQFMADGWRLLEALSDQHAYGADDDARTLVTRWYEAGASPAFATAGIRNFLTGHDDNWPAFDPTCLPGATGEEETQ